MSSIVNKSGVRFTPKVRQRRSVTGTPVQSRKASVTPAPAPEDPLSKEPDNEALVSSDVEPEDNDKEAAVGMITPNPTQKDSLVTTTPSSRRPSVVEPVTKQRRLSTLSNASRAGDLFRKTSFSGPNTEHRPSPSVISIPAPQIPAKRRRSSVAAGPRSVLGKRRGTSEDIQSASVTPAPTGLPTPISTQDPSQTLSKAEGKQIVDDVVRGSIAEVDEEQEEAPHAKLEGPKSEENSIPQRLEGLIYDKAAGCLRKVTYDPTDAEAAKKVIKRLQHVSKYDELSRSLYSLDPKQLEIIRIDETSFRMEDLCKPSLPIGKVSPHFQKVQEARKNRMAARKKRQELRQQAKRERKSLESYEEANIEEKKIKPEEMLDDANLQEPSQHNAIKLKLSNDGQLVVDEESRVVDRHRNMDNIVRERLDENPFENLVNSATYGKQRYTDKWDRREVAKLYQALGQWGTDFALIAQMFPYRTRRQIKAKFILEEKKHPRMIELALSNKLKTEFDFDAYCEDANKTFGTLDDFNAKLERIKQEHEQNLKELTLAKEKAKEEDLQNQKKKEFEIQTGQRTMTRKERLMELNKHETVLGSIDDIKKQRQNETATAGN